MKFNKILFVAFLLTISVNCFSQISVTSYSIYSLGISTSQNKTISGELKTFANRSVDDLLFEVDVFYNFKPSDFHRFSVGVGLNSELFAGSDPINAFTIPVQLEIYPLQDFKRFSVLFELTPQFIIEDDVNVRSLWGLRYTFGN
ncbi:hypothetical protein [Carboxylicivirga sp. M1479]|uniref:hypothetical protein n=1 Tax=Carboxylicivirga sp. M1479 TaxID=2594476 RepID=UPI001177B9B8|nr:hypothetical protein [Carboxylicivirga sp. M1479]TRX71542.1 hypothetical protein FNN09_06105 [Carboxylicivirga sp. M1479]